VLDSGIMINAYKKQ